MERVETQRDERRGSSSWHDPEGRGILRLDTVRRTQGVVTVGQTRPNGGRAGKIRVWL